MGDASKSMPGMAAGATLNKGYADYLKEYGYYRGMAWLVTRPWITRKLLGDLSGDVNSAIKAKDLFNFLGSSKNPIIIYANNFLS